MPAYGYSPADLREWDRTGVDPHIAGSTPDLQTCSICGERHAAAGCRLPMLVSLVIDDEVITQQYSFHNLRKSLRLAWELMGGIPQAYVGIWYKGRRLAELETNFRGELAEASVCAERGGHILMTPLNPNGPIFAGVFAR